MYAEVNQVEGRHFYIARFLKPYLTSTTIILLVTADAKYMLQGKGTMKTYWLYGKKNYDKPLPEYNIEAAAAP